MFKRLSINGKLALFVIIPFIAIVVYSVMLLQASAFDMNALKTSLPAMQLFEQNHEMIRALQNEREKGVLYTVGDAKKSEFIKATEKTDALVDYYNQLLEEALIPDEIKKKVLEQEKMLAEVRKKFYDYKSVGFKQSIGAYQDMIFLLVHIYGAVVNTSTTKGTGKKMMTLSILEIGYEMQSCFKMRVNKFLCSGQKITMSDFHKIQIFAQNAGERYNSPVLSPSKASKPLIDKIKKDKIFAVNQKYLNLLQHGEPANNYGIDINQFNKDMHTVLAQLEHINHTELNFIQSLVKRFSDELRANLIKTRIMSIVFLVVLIAFAIIMGRSISKPVNDMMKLFPTLLKKEGQKVDLTKKLDIKYQNEFGKLSGYVNQLMSQMNDDFTQILDTFLSTAAASDSLIDVTNMQSREAEKIGASIGEIGMNVEQQTAGIEEVTTSLEEMTRNIKNISNNISRQASAVEESASTIEEMGRNIENITRVSAQTKEISVNLNRVAQEGGDAVRESIHSIQDVAEYSNQILKLLKLITDISKQTNLLAMNASIEAAHAGEAGKGFAIVAEEIRRLSETTNKNAKDIQDVVNTILEKIATSVVLSDKAGEGLTSIMDFAKQSEDTIKELSFMMEEQNASNREILDSTQDLVTITEEVDIAMKEQKTGVDEFAITMRNLRTLFLETKDSIDGHLGSLENLINLIETMEQTVNTNKDSYENIHRLLDKFELDKMSQDASKIAEEETSMKLVE